MPLTFKVTGADGQEGTVTSQDVMQDLQEGGFEPVGLSPDGMNVTFMGSKGEFTRSIPEIAQQMGHQIGEVFPDNPGTEHLDAGLRFSVENITDDDDRQMYIQAKLDRQYGENAPKAMGQGSDWYYFDPQSGGYQALTNAQGVDMSDIGQVGAMAPKMAAEMGGFAMGGPAGAGVANLMANATLKSIAATKEGKGAEQIGYGASFGTPGGEVLPSDIAGALQDEQPGASEETAASIRGNIDPDFIDQGGGPAMLGEAGISTLFGGAIKGAGKLLPRTSAAVQSGPVSRAAEGVGWGAEAGGAGARRVGQAVAESPFLKETATYLGPLGNPAFAGTMARLPRGATTMAAEGMGKLRGVADKIAPEIGPPQSQAGSWVASKLRNIAGGAEEAMRPRGAGVADQVLSGARNITPEGVIGANARDILGNLGEMGGGKLQEMANRRALDSLLKGGSTKMADMGVRAGDFAAKGLPRAGEIAGQGLENVARLGRGVEGLAMGTTKLGARGLQYGGQAANVAGRGLQSAGRMAKPFEPYVYYGAGRQGIESARGAMPDIRSEEEIMFDRWRKRRERDNMGLDFAQNR